MSERLLGPRLSRLRGCVGRRPPRSQRRDGCLCLGPEGPGDPDMLLKPLATGGSRPRVSGEPAHALPSICYGLRISEFTPEAPSFTGLRVSGQDFEEFQGFVQSSQIRSPVGVLSKILCAAKAFLRAPSHTKPARPVCAACRGRVGRWQRGPEPGRDGIPSAHSLSLGQAAPCSCGHLGPRPREAGCACRGLARSPAECSCPEDRCWVAGAQDCGKK